MRLVIGLLILMLAPALASDARAQHVEVHAPATSVPLHSVDDFFVHPAPRPVPPARSPARVKSSRTRDPEGVQQWRDLLQRFPPVLPPTSGFVEDRAPQGR